MPNTWELEKAISKQKNKLSEMEAEAEKAKQAMLIAKVAAEDAAPDGEAAANENLDAAMQSLIAANKASLAAERKLIELEDDLKEAQTGERPERRELKILFLPANVIDGVHIYMDAEVNTLTNNLSYLPLHGKVTLRRRWATQLSDIVTAVEEIEPDIVHFAGRCTDAGELVLRDEQGNPRLVKAHEAAGAIAFVCPKTRLCFFNARFYGEDVKKVVAVMDMVVGMRKKVSEQALISFTGSIYAAAGFGRDLGSALNIAKAALELHYKAEAGAPIIYLKDGFNPDKTTLLPLGNL